MHGDQTHGINDLRSFYINSRKQLCLSDKYTSKYLKSTFSYIFKAIQKYPATLKLNKLPKYIITKNNKKRFISINYG